MKTKVSVWQCPLCGDTFSMRPNSGCTFKTGKCRRDWHTLKNPDALLAHDNKHRFEFWMWDILGTKFITD